MKIVALHTMFSFFLKQTIDKHCYRDVKIVLFPQLEAVSNFDAKTANDSTTLDEY